MRGWGVCPVIQIGMILGGRYEILNHIGSGGMADVYRARCHRENRYVAIKILRQEFNEDEAFVRRFIAEAKATAGLDHPNIVRIYNAGHDQGYHYIVMELCEGTTLKRYIRRYGRLSVRETVDFSKQMARGIQAAHAIGLVHRDIKPQNILVSDSGKLKVADFGIARAASGDTMSQNMMGSVHYLSPEQARGGYADQRSDIYSLGITMYEMATGHVPFDGENEVTIALMHLKNEITPPRCFFPDIPVSLEKIILKCTMKRQSDRYQNAQELLEDLEEVFTQPDGDYVYSRPMLDDSPTIHRTRKDLSQMREGIREYTDHMAENQEEIASEEQEAAADRDDSIRIRKGGPQEIHAPEEESHTSEEQEEESMKTPMRRMIYVITAAGGILLAMILIYLIVSSTGILRRQKQAEATSATTEEVTEASQVSMPDVLGKDRQTAQQEVSQAGLKADFEYEGDLTESDTDLIVTKQQYKAGDMLEEGSTVLLTLGKDPQATTESKRVEVPLLINDKEEEAVSALEELGLKVEKLYASSDTVKEGYVIKQTPTAGTEVDRGFTIAITISKGVSKVRVPSLTGLSQKAARDQLNNVGLELGEVTSDYNGSVGVGEVFRQGTEPGTMVDKGSAVDVVISLGEGISYHYEGEIYIMESPFAEGESGLLELVLNENGQMTSIFSQDDMTADDFPFDYTFEGNDEGEAEVILYINGEEYSREPVTLTAVED